MRALFFATLPLFVVSIVACSGNVTTTSTGSAASGGGVGGAGGSGSGGPACPVDEPNGGACNVPGTRCTYGDSVRPECRREHVCENGSWSNDVAICGESTTCPSAVPQSGADCSPEGDVCTYGATLCECNACIGGPCMQFPKWSCQGPPADAGCPEIVPNDGSACSQEGLICTYGNLCGISGAIAECTNGAWFWQGPIPCPA